MNNQNTSAISLRDVPTRLLDSARWTNINSFAKTEIKGLQLLNAPPPEGPFVEFWNTYPEGEIARQRIHQQGRELCAEFRRLMQSEKIIAFGYPHMAVDYFACDADAFIRTQDALLATSDLVIAATGSWAAETRLDSWHAENERTVPIIYTWTEAHACAGHAVLITSNASLRDGFSSTGVPLFAITEWPDGPTERSEPACGAIFQPYGPVELGFTTNIAAELALDSLVGKDISLPHRTWVGSSNRLRDAGGVWSTVWRREPQFREEGNFVVLRLWPIAGMKSAAGEVAA